VEAREGLEAPGRAVTGAAADAGDLPAGRAAWVHGRVAGGGPLSLRLLADAPVEAGGAPADGLAPVVAPPRVELGACEAAMVTGELGAALKALFGARKLLGLEHLAHGHYAHDVDGVAAGLRKLGYDQAAVTEALGAAPIYPEQRARFVANALKQFLVSESLAYGLPCSETAFVATRREAGQPIGRSVPVNNALPAGMDTRFEVAASRPRMGMAPPMAAPAPVMASAPDLAFDAIAYDAPGVAYAPPPAAKRSQAPRAKAPLGKPALGGAGKAQTGGLAQRKTEAAPLFTGIPAFSHGEAVLFDGPYVHAIRGLLVPGLPANLDPELVLVIYVDDPSAPRARVKLADLARQGGRRPLNLVGQHVRIVLVDPKGAWQGTLAVTLEG
jgi:Ca-activated chloride channel family protein